jgi:predicted metal-dependent phosphoesterase TrpH
VVDLHLHTTASDGRLTPAQLVDVAAAARLRVMAVTDHDTTAASREVRTLADARGIVAISGIEITAVHAERDVHVLGYFLDADDQALSTFLASQREARVQRVGAIAERLASLGMPIDIAPLLAEARQQSGRSIGRPQVARAMVAAGYVADTRQAFDRWLAAGLPAFIPREGASPEQVIDVIHAAGGLASIAHPGKSVSDARLAALRDAGLDAIEVFHPDHVDSQEEHYRELAGRLDLLMTGGSDFHGDPGHGLPPGTVTLPDAEWQRLSSSSTR